MVSTPYHLIEVEFREMNLYFVKSEPNLVHRLLASREHGAILRKPLGSVLGGFPRAGNACSPIGTKFGSHDDPIESNKELYSVEGYNYC